jgi:hypothetical protein
VSPNDLIAKDTWESLVNALGEQALTDVAASLGLNHLGALIEIVAQAGGLASLGAVRALLMDHPEYTFVDFLALIDGAIVNIERGHP